MKRIFLVAALACVPSLGWGASAGQWWDLTYWYLGPKAEVPLLTADGRIITHNTGYMRVERPEGGLAGRTFSEGWFLPPSGLNVDTNFRTWHGAIEPGSSGLDGFNLTFDADENLVDWAFSHVPWRAEFGPALYINPRRDEVLFFNYGPEPPEVLFSAEAGTWYRSELAYNEAAKAAGVAPIPLPGAAWLLIGGMAALAGLRFRRAA